MVVIALGALADLRRARVELETARRQADPAALAEGEPLELMGRAYGHLADASVSLRSPIIAPARQLPVVGRQLRSAAALSTAARNVAGAALDGLTAAQEILSGPRPAGPARVAVARRLAEVAGDTERRLARIDLGPRIALFPALARTYNELAGELDALRSALARARLAASGVAEVLQGPSRYLLFAANNAEMRAGSGMFLSVGELTMEDGAFTVGAMRTVTDVAVPPGTVPLTGDYADRWGWLEPNVEWRNLMLSPRFDVNAPLAADMWRAAGGGPVDGVLAVDPVALAALLGGTGPIDVDGRPLSEETVVDELLYHQYTRFSPEEVTARRDELGRVAEALFMALEAGQGTLAGLARGLGEAAGGRHLLAWSMRPELREIWQELGVDGSLGDDSLQLSLLNRSGTKLDRFLRTSATVTVTDGPEGGMGVTIDVTVANEVPTGEHPYIAGPVANTGAVEGEYVGLLAVQLPAVARGGRIEPSEGLAVAGPDGPTRVVAAPFNLRRGEEKHFAVRFELPVPSASLRVEASARVPPSRWSYGSQRWVDDRTRAVVLRGGSGG